MTDSVPTHKLVSAEEMRGAIERIIEKRRTDAYQSQYDVMVCVRSVDAAREVLESIPVEGTARDYGKVMEAALSDLRERFYDDDGEYTSKGLVGDIDNDVYRLLRSQESSDLVDVDHDEARACLLEEMNTLARLTPQPYEGAVEAAIKVEVNGASGFSYFVKIVFEDTDEGVAMSGRIFADDTYRFPLLEETLILGETAHG